MNVVRLEESTLTASTLPGTYCTILEKGNHRIGTTEWVASKLGIGSFFDKDLLAYFVCVGLSFV